MFSSIFSAVGGTLTGLNNQFYGINPQVYHIWWTTSGERPGAVGSLWRDCANNSASNPDFTNCRFEYQGNLEARGQALAVLTGDVLVPVEPPVTTVPAPSTYAQMAAGLAALGFVSRRRRRALVA
jgi:hypothetical protein